MSTWHRSVSQTVMKEYSIPYDTVERRPRALALGVFEGLHIGHRAVICQAAGREDLTAAILTFSGHLPKGEGGVLMLPDRRIRLLENMGIAEQFILDFEAIRDLSPEEFVRDILRNRLDARLVACGFNYRFGKDGAGTVETLRRLGQEYGIQVVSVPAVEVEGKPVSTSRIRRCLEAGNMALANRLLGMPFTLDFEVVHGRQLGRELGTPTINQPLPAGFIQPRFGVYASAVEVEGRVTYGVTNIGVKPTVGAEAPLAETWIPEYEGDLYGQRIRVSPLRFLREEKTFASIAQLKEQIHRDGDTARREILGEPADDTGLQAVLFDFDDTLQDREKAFSQYACYFLNRYFPRLEPAVREERLRQMLRLQNGGYVDYVEYFRSLKERWDWRDGPSPEELTTQCRYHFSRYTSLYPETVEVLKECRRRGWKTGIVTNGPSLLQNRKLDFSGLRPLLDVVVVSGDEGIHKPDPEIFRRAAARLGTAPTACVYVGDHPVNDVQGALAAGMTPVYIRVTDQWGTPPDDVARIGRLGDLFQIL